MIFIKKWVFLVIFQQKPEKNKDFSIKNGKKWLKYLVISGIFRIFTM
jgi:hypothetical protein